MARDLPNLMPVARDLPNLMPVAPDLPNLMPMAPGLPKPEPVVQDLLQPEPVAPEDWNLVLLSVARGRRRRPELPSWLLSSRPQS